ncbi:MmgE/PrpD family protein [Pseudonocardia halophobica]|uniref:MmgE/PrpD family protein n=1 Tax=Pseudonocardia halophobica TaxID=29401 RepID=UPI003D8A29ED
MDETLAFLADYAAGLTFDDLSTGAVHEAKRRLIDVFGCALGAYPSEPATIARAHAAESTGNPGATVFGTGHLSSAESAAYANGVMFRYLDFNDMSMARNGGGHPSDMLAALLAAAEYGDADPRRFLTGLVLAYEIADRLADVCDISIGRGWDYPTWIAMGSAYGASKALGLQREQIAHAVALAVVANVSLYQTRRGTLSMWKGAAGGNACRNGLFAALLARRGMTGPAEPYLGDSGFFNQCAGGPVELPRFGGDGHPFKLEESKLKYFPADYEAQTSVHPAAELRKAIGGRLDEIDKIEIQTYGVAIMIAADTPAKWAPTTRETADHSIPYLVALGLTRGDVGIEDFTPERIADPELRALMAKMTITENPRYTEAYSESTFFHIKATLRTGEHHVAEIRYPKGHPKNPMTDAEVEEKFRHQAAPLMGAEQMDALLDRCWSLEDARGLGEIMALTRLAYQA